MQTEHENKYFDRKSAKIKPSDLAPLISAFANAEGGTIVIGISDKTLEIEGIHQYGMDKVNEFIAIPKNGCKPMPQYNEEFLNVINSKGKEDQLLLLHIQPCVDQIVRTINDSTYLRIGDKTKELKGDDLRNLEYAKSTRHFEDEINRDASIEDLDEELISEYKEKLDASHLPTEQVLKARAFIKSQDGNDYLTNAAVLLFAKNISQFYPNCRVRFVRYDGNSAQVGTRMNIIKDKNIECNILKLIDETRLFISSQLREFTALDPLTGKFKTVPEYPEFSWLEGIVNAVTHREYGMSGRYILVTMFDDRLEIKSPGKLPNIVTVDNIKDTRYARNPRISRVLTDFGWVRELNEGVKRIYSDMADFFLDEPEYSEPEYSVKLILKNNIVMRNIRQESRLERIITPEIWQQLDELEKSILTYLASKKTVTRAELCTFTSKAPNTISARLNHLIKLNIIKRNGSKYDPKQTYEMK
ncbi:putative DNA binding domain-containing protein [[Clostridium] spiroforme]|nr:putative DNA binding domain-containing protein [Thomasclavelia spiroformis]MBM6879671.1 putative DNA binding domain-containing protein [Thomasclavelia spiroformis]